MLGKLKKLIFLILGLSFLVFILLGTSTEAITTSENGVLDFSNVQDLNSYNPLDGQWYFFHRELLSYNDVKTKIENNEGKLFDLPNSFENHVGEKNTYGTYAAILKIPESYIGELLAIHIPYEYSAYKFFVNNKLISRNGTPGNNEISHSATMAPKIGYFTPETDEVTLTFQVSSFEHIRGGFENSIFFGDADTVVRKFNSNLIFNLFINGAIFIIGLFLLLLTLHQKRGLSNFIFGSFCMVISARALFSVPFYYTILFPKISWLWGTRLEYILTEASSGLFVIFIWSLHQRFFSKRIMQILVSVAFIPMVITLFTKPIFFQTLFFNVFYITVPGSIYIVYVIIRSIRNHSLYAKMNLIGIFVIIGAFFNDFLVGQNIYQSESLMLMAVAIYVLIHVIVLSKSFADQAKKQEQLNTQLSTLNTSLDAKVVERTKQLEKVNLHLQELASKDGLTGIYNRTAFNEYIEDCFEDQKNLANETALLLMDIDNFKLYNDTYGHVKGDELLRNIVGIIEGSLPPTAFFARYGGEEFAVIFENTSYEQSLNLAENIRVNLEKRKFEHKNSVLGYVTISIGVAMLTKNSTFSSPVEWIDAADNKLYQSKVKGKNQVT